MTGLKKTSFFEKNIFEYVFEREVSIKFEAE